MLCVKGNKTIEVNLSDLLKLMAGFTSVELDLGTGDGLFVYKKALLNQNIFYVGVDPSQKLMQETSVRAVRKKLKNIIFVIGSLEVTPTELLNVSNKVTVNFPWGTLLQSVAKPNVNTAKRIKSLLKPSGTLEIIFGYEPKLEPTETKRLELLQIDLSYITNEVIPVFESQGFKCTKLEELDQTQILEIGTSWSKKIKTTESRPFYSLTFLS